MQSLEQEAWIVRLYRSFCNSIYGRFAVFYNLTSFVVSLGQWSKWRCLCIDFIDKGKVLELGFGTGVLQGELSRRGFETYGLEYSKDMHKITASHLSRCRQTSRRVLADGSVIPFKDEAFDSLVATFPEQYIAKVETLKECHRILKAGTGKMVIVGRWIELKSNILQSFFPVFYRRPSEKEVSEYKQAFSDAGLEMEIQLVEMGFVRHRVVVAKRVT